MSRLSPEMIDMERVANIEYLEKKAHDKAIAEWLQNNPEVGTLNGGKYYRVVNNEVLYIQPLSNEVLYTESLWKKRGLQ